MYGALDVDGIGAWTVANLKEFAGRHPITAIVPVGHGAAFAVIVNGRLACAPMDYEQSIPPDVLTRYRLQRDAFAITGSPALPAGLNAGAQLYWLEELDPNLLCGDARIVPWAQYWAWFLSGVAASEVTSLGCHTDLWDPAAARPSPMATARGWHSYLAPVRPASDVLGVLRPELAAHTGLSRHTQIYCGLHDSNAALLAARGFPEIADCEATVVSTGTWFLAMRIPDTVEAALGGRLDERRDCLINVDVSGKAIPTARFMGGREIEMLTANCSHRLDHGPDQSELLAAVESVVRKRTRVLPAVIGGVGPFPHARHRWDREPDDSMSRRAAAGLYAALMMDASLNLAGARQRIIVGGRFADAEVFVRALASQRPDTMIYVNPTHDAVAHGALRVVFPDLATPGSLRRVEPLSVALDDYFADWRAEAEHLERVA